MVREKILSDVISFLLAPVLPGPPLQRRWPFSWGQGTAVGVSMGSYSPVLVS